MNNSKDNLLKKCEKNVVYFGTVINPRMAKVKTPAFHYELAWAWHNKRKQVVVQAPRGSAKSTVAGTSFPMHHICFDKGDKFIILISKTLGHAKDLLSKIQNILEYSNNFKSLFGYYGESSPYVKTWTQNEIRFTFNNLDGTQSNVRIMCRGMEQQIVGLNYLDQRPTYVLFDDPEDINNTKTIERLNTNYDILKKGIIPGLDPITGRVWVIGTPQLSNGMVNKLEDLGKETGKELVSKSGGYIHDGDWLSYKYRTIINEAERKVLWEEWLGYDAIMAKKREAEFEGKLSGWYSEYQCEIISTEYQIFRQEDLRYYDGHLEVDEYGDTYLKITRIGTKKELKDVDLRISVNTYLGCDPASSLRKTADYSVTFPVAYDNQKRIFCLPYFRSRVVPNAHARQIFNKAQEIKAKRTTIETIGYQEMLRTTLKEMCLEEGVYISGLNQDSKETKPRADKSERLLGMQPYFASHRVYLLIDQMETFEDELLLFPRAKNDDLLDGFYYATLKMLMPYHTPDNKPKEHKTKKKNHSYQKNI